MQKERIKLKTLNAEGGHFPFCDNYIRLASRTIVKGLKYRLPTLIYLPAFQKSLTLKWQRTFL